MNKTAIIILSCVTAAAVTAGTATGVILYRGADRRAVESGFSRLSEDLDTRATEVISASETAALIDAVMYGDAHIEASVNVGGIDISGMIPDGMVGAGMSAVLGNTKDITIGADAVIDRRCTDEELSVQGSLSIMNYTLADIGIYAQGDMAYLDLPKMADMMYEVDLNNISGAIDDSGFLRGVWDELGLPGYRSVELFGHAEERDVWDVIGDMRDGMREAAEQKEDIRRMWKNAEIERRDEEAEVKSSSGEADGYTCRVYDVTIAQEDAQAVLNHMIVDGDEAEDTDGAGSEQTRTVTVDGDVSFTVYIDEYKDIRCIETINPLKVNGGEYDIRIELTGEELPIDEVDIIYDAGTGVSLVQNGDGDSSIRAHVLRDGKDYEIEVSSGDAAAQGVLTPKYDRGTRALDLKYTKLSLTYRGEEILRSSGQIEISADEEAVDVKPVPTRDRTEHFDEFALNVMEHLFGGIGALLGLLG